jgi:hypothetical protein
VYEVRVPTAQGETAHKLLLVVDESSCEGKPTALTLNLETGQVMDHWAFSAGDWERRGWRVA